MSPGLDVVRDVLTTITGRDAGRIGEQDRLTDLGLDSLDRVLLAVLIEEHSGHPLTDVALAGIRTVADLQRHLQPTGNLR